MAVVEIELDSPEQGVVLPAWLGEAVEVTGDKRYSNAALAREDLPKP